jgi:hypothetical protein
MNRNEGFDEMPDEIDFTGAVREHFAGRLSRETVAVVVEPELHAAFPNDAAVNEALRLVLQAGDLARNSHAGRSTVGQA